MTVLVGALAGITALVVGIAMPGVAIAHNAGHIFRPDGSCLELGSFKHGPLVGADRTRLDLVPQTPRDEFGVSFVGYWDNAPVPGAVSGRFDHVPKGDLRELTVDSDAGGPGIDERRTERCTRSSGTPGSRKRAVFQRGAEREGVAAEKPGRADVRNRWRPGPSDPL